MNKPTLGIEKEPLSSRPFAGLGMQADCYIYDDVNRQFGVTDEDYVLWERRLKALRPGLVRIFLPTTEFNPSGDGCTYDWETVEMQRQYRNMAVLREAGASVNLCMGPWTNQEMCKPGSERMAVDLVKHLVRERGCDHLRWLTLFNEPDTIYAPDTPLEQELRAEGLGGEGRPWPDYVAMHQSALELLAQCGLANQVRLVIADTVWPPRRRLERLTLSAREFSGPAVGFGFHHYVPSDPEFFNHPDVRQWKPLPLAEEIQSYRTAVGLDEELIGWEYNNFGYGAGSAWMGAGSRGEDFVGTFDCAVASMGKILTMLANGMNGLSHWCLGDMFYRSGLPQGVMYCGLWRYKWANWTPRPTYFYYAALIHAFRPGAILHAVSGLSAGLIGLAARTEEGWVVALLNPGALEAEFALDWSGRGKRLRVSPDRLPRQPDCPARKTLEDELPLHHWEPVPAGPVPCQLDPCELTILQLWGGK